MDYKQLERNMIKFRRDFHKFPEAAWTEFRTSSIVARELEKLGYKPIAGDAVIEPTAVMGRPSEDEIAKHKERAIAQGGDKGWIEKMGRYTGVVADLETGRPGPTLALRFDMDCVDVDEDRNSTRLPVQGDYASVNPNLMHACGHDAHTAIGLGVAALLQDPVVKNKLTGRVRLIFQPGEEGCRGAYAMTQKGVVDDADYFLAMHIGGGHATGTFGLDSLGYLATTKFDVKFTGVPAHAAGSPHMGHNALLAAASATLALHAIAPHSGGNMRVNVGVLQAGTGRNVIPGAAFMKVETRGESQEIADYVYARAIEILNGAATMYGVTVEITKAGQGTTAQGSPELIARVGHAVRNSGLFAQVLGTVTGGGSEDATWMERRVQERGGQATYMALGSTIAAPHHNGCFDIDESAMLLGARAMVAIAEELLGKR